MKKLQCKCGVTINVNDNVESVVCWKCSLQKVARYERGISEPLFKKFDIETIIEKFHAGEICDIRKSMKYTQEKMAKLLGMSQQQYNRYENLILPTTAIIKKVEKKLVTQQLQQKKEKEPF